MKKLPLWGGMAVGALIGLFTSIPDGVGLKIVMMSIGVVAGAAVGGAFSPRWKNDEMELQESDESFGQGTSARDRMRNFWRDKGRPVRFSEPPDFDGTGHNFDQ